MKKYLNREIYLSKVAPFIDKDIIKVVTGQRRVGKSYLLYQVMDKIKKGDPDASIIYINKELYEFDFIRTYHDLLKEVKRQTKKSKKTYLFIDEIQDIEQFEKALRSLLAEGGYDIYCSGSNASLLSGELATFLSGRYIEIKVYGLSYNEFLTFQSLKNDNRALDKYIKYGGLPYLRNLVLDDEIVFDYLKNVFNTIILKDIVARYNLRNVYLLENLIKFIADNVGSIFSAKKISDYLKSQQIKISPNIILNYLNYLCSSYFLSKTRRIDIKGKKIFEVGEKYYFEDLGLRHVVKPFMLTDINKVIENVVYNHLQICGYDVMVGQLAGKEIDFVCTRKAVKVYVQVSYLMKDQKTIEREYGNLLAIKDNFRKIVVSMDSVSGSSYKGIEHIFLKDFLTYFT